MSINRKSYRSLGSIKGYTSKEPTGPGKHNKKLCPCKICMAWRMRTFRPGIFSIMQGVIRLRILEDRKINKLVEGLLD